MDTAKLHDLAGPRSGDVIDGKYRVEGVLGAGAMGVVVAAHHLQLDETFAIKVLRPEALSQPHLVARFVAEARAAARVRSEHVVRVVDVGALANGLPYMIMEYLEGRDVEAWVAKDGPLAIAQAVEVLLQTCVAVADVHALGMVHRDLKPANLFCVQRTDGQLVIKLLDFGISKIGVRVAHGKAPSLRSTWSSRESHPGVQPGTPSYMAPEQTRAAGDVDARTDIWALGVVLYELLTADTPFKAETLAQLASEVATAPTPSVRARRAEVPEALEAVINRCLEKSPDARFATVAELALALKPLAPERAVWSLPKPAPLPELAAKLARLPNPAPLPNLSPAPRFWPELPLAPKSTLAPTGPRATVAAPSIPIPPMLFGGGDADASGSSERPSDDELASELGRSLALKDVLWPRSSPSWRKVAVYASLALGLAFFVFLGADWRTEHSDAAKLAPPREEAGSNGSDQAVQTGASQQSGAALLDSGVEADRELKTVPASALPVPARPARDKAQLPNTRPAVKPPADRTPRAKFAPKPVEKPAPKPVVKPKAAQDCTPPYYFDAQGNRLFKKECV